jgi:sugar lactone lactonase YvrE
VWSATAAFAALLTLNLHAVETKFWQQNDQSDFEKGSFENISLRSDGRMFLAPSTREIFDSSTPYLWAIASDSKGALFTAGGGDGSGRAKVFEIAPDGKSRTVAELGGLEIHAIAIDKHDQIYAATDPDGKVYKVARDGKSVVYYDPHAKYIWAMAFDNAGNLFVATGDQGEIHRVTPDGKGSVFFRTEETHARSLAIDKNGNLIVGTEPGGLILRISPSAAGFVLYQAPKREITSVAIASDGAIYAAGVGTRSQAPSVVTTPLTSQPSVTPPSASGSSQGAVQISGRPPTTSQQPPSLPPGTVPGGSDVYRIDADGAPHKVWSNSQDVVYAIAFDSKGLPLIGSGNRGRVYRLDSDILSTQLVSLAPTQATSFATTPEGGIFTITGNIGKVYRIGPGLARSGKYESEALDAGSFAYWGRLALRGSGTGVDVRTRSGNLNRPVNNWSSWTAVPLQPNGEESSGRIASPSARFVQYEVALTGSGAKPPEVSEVEIAYLTKNVAPVVQQIEITPANYKFPTQSLSLTPSTSLTLAPLGQKRASSTSSGIEIGTSVSLNYAKGYIGARWLAHDENGDTLVYKVEIRGRGENEWKLLKDKLKDKELSWDSTAFPDGEYELRVTASDAPDNPPAAALSSSLISEPFLIDNTPPQIIGLSATANGSRIDVRWRAKDARSIIDHAEYSVNGGEWLVVEPVNKLSDSPEEDYHLIIDRPSPGEQTIAVRVSDYYDNQAVEKAVVK